MPHSTAVGNHLVTIFPRIFIYNHYSHVPFYLFLSNSTPKKSISKQFYFLFFINFEILFFVFIFSYSFSGNYSAPLDQVLWLQACALNLWNPKQAAKNNSPPTVPHQLEGSPMIDEVHIPHELEGFPSDWWGTSTSSAGRFSFQLMRYIYLINWKGFLPIDEVHLPHQLEGFPSN
jgi:hypothetical protein